MSASPEPPAAPPRRGLGAALESAEPRRRSFADYRNFIKDHYDGLPGALTAVTGFVTGHEALAGRLIHPRAFDVRGCKRILDAACGNGRYSKFLLKQADGDAVLTSFDLSPKMLLRARARVRSPRVTHAVADLTRLPYADAAFDARELHRVLAPGGKLLLLATEDTLTGAMCSRLWHCRTYNRGELRRICEDEVGLRWHRELWFSGIHKMLRLGGIIVELRKE